MSILCPSQAAVVVLWRSFLTVHPASLSSSTRLPSCIARHRESPRPPSHGADKVGHYYT